MTQQVRVHNFTVSRDGYGAGEGQSLHVAVAPVELGGGSRLWSSPEELLDRYHCDVVPRPDGVVHHLFWRK